MIWSNDIDIVWSDVIISNLFAEVIWLDNEDGALAQLGERLAGSQKVRGSIPLGSTNFKVNASGHVPMFLFFRVFPEKSHAQKVSGWLAMSVYDNSGTNAFSVFYKGKTDCYYLNSEIDVDWLSEHFKFTVVKRS